MKLAEFQEGKTLAKYLATATAAERTAVIGKVRKGFVMDALLGNWDVVGADLDNILVDAAGEVSNDALEAVKKSLSTAASVPRDVVESAIKGSEGKAKA